jgi:hypothetical protein
VDAVAVARELERQDAAVAEALAQIDALMDAVARLAAEDATTRVFLAAFPGEDALRRADLARAEEDHLRAEHALEQAQAALVEAERHRDEARRLAALRAHEHAQATAMVGRQHLDRVRARVASLELEHEAAVASRATHAAAAELLATDLRSAPHISLRAAFELSDPEAIASWASSVRAALLVARSGLAAERDAVLRQAAELAAATLGEPLAGGRVSLLRERLERAS